MNLRYIRHPNRLERSQPDVEGQVGNDDTPRADPLQNLGSEMQTGGGRSDRSALTRKDRLVTLAVQRLILTANVWGQRHMPQKLQPGEEIIHRREAKKAFAELAIGHDRSLQSHVPLGRREGQLLTHRHPARRAGQRPPFPVADLFSQQHFHFGALPGRRPNNRAGITRLSFNTSTSPSRSNSGSCLNHESCHAPLSRSRGSMRLSPRSAGGSCAISSGGSSKSKSETSTDPIV